MDLVIHDKDPKKFLKGESSDAPDIEELSDNAKAAIERSRRSSGLKGLK